MSDPISAMPPLTVQAEKIDFQRTGRLKPTEDGADGRIREAKLRKASQDFESLFMYKLLKSMRATVPKSEEAGFGMETMREITDEQMAVYLAQQGGIGLGDMLFQSLNRQIPQADPAVSGDNSQPQAVAAVPDGAATPKQEKPAEATVNLAPSCPTPPVVQNKTGE